MRMRILKSSHSKNPMTLSIRSSFNFTTIVWAKKLEKSKPTKSEKEKLKEMQRAFKIL